jgi:hypothetical protein
MLTHWAFWAFSWHVQIRIALKWGSGITAAAAAAAVAAVDAASAQGADAPKEAPAEPAKPFAETSPPSVTVTNSLTNSITSLKGVLTICAAPLTAYLRTVQSIRKRISFVKPSECHVEQRVQSSCTLLQFACGIGVTSMDRFLD